MRQCCTIMIHMDLGSKNAVACARVGGANAIPLFCLEFFAAYFAKRNLNGDDFQSEGAAEGGCGGNSAMPERIELSPRHLPEYLEGRTPKKNVLSFLEEIGRAQIRKARNIFLWCPPSPRGGGGASSFVGVLRKMGSNFFKQTPQKVTHLVDLRGVEPRPVPCHGTVLPLYYRPFSHFILLDFWVRIKRFKFQK